MHLNDKAAFILSSTLICLQTWEQTRDLKRRPSLSLLFSISLFCPFSDFCCLLSAFSSLLKDIEDLVAGKHPCLLLVVLAIY